MGEAAILFSQCREQFETEDNLAAFALKVVNGHISPQTCTTAQLRRLDQLARNHVINRVPYSGEAQRCVDARDDGRAFYHAFNDLVRFCARVVSESRHGYAA